MISSKEALQKLIDGNQRYISGNNSLHNHNSDLSSGQKPFAVILGCSDSRVAPELIFDQGHGELFVVRVAGNIAESSQQGSIEYAVNHLGVKLVVVLGHSGCGAVTATAEALKSQSTDLSSGMQALVDNIEPSVKKADYIIEKAVRENIKAQVQKLKLCDDCLVVGAEFCLESGTVILI